LTLILEQKTSLKRDLPLNNLVQMNSGADQTRFRISSFIKHLMDLVGSAFLIVVLSPLLLGVSIFVALDAGRPIFYRRRVVGKDGEFDAFKFRTMKRDADAILNADSALRAEFERNFKLKNDPRITRAGSLLRKISLDELPQLFNIFLGQMSFVGPRMFTAAEVEKYGPHKQLILSVKPGLTGYWQVNGRQNVSYEERVKMDVQYIENWSLSLDAKILLQTPFKVFKREGAF